MPDAPVTESASTETVSYSKPQQSAPTAPPFAPPNPKAMVDMNAKSRHARLAKLQEELGEYEDSRRNAKIRGEDPDKEEAEASTEGEMEDGARSAEGAAKERAEGADDAAEAEEAAETKAKVAPRETEEERLEKRRAAVKAKVNGDDLVEPKEGEEPAAEAAAEPEDKAKEEASKIDKERKEKFQRVLAMEAKAQKEKDRLRSIEGRLVQREKELEHNIARARSEYQAAVKRSENEVRMARQIMQLAQDNPLALLEQAGATPEDVATWVSRASDPHTVELNKIKRELADRDRRAQEAERRANQQQAEIQRQNQMRAVEREYLSAFDEKGADDTPAFDAALTVYSERERLQIGHELADAAFARKYSFTHRDIAEAVNAMAMEDPRYKKIQERLSKVATPVAAAKPAAAVAKPAVAKPTVLATNEVAQQAAEKPKVGIKQDYKAIRAQRNRRFIAGLDE